MLVLVGAGLFFSAGREKSENKIEAEKDSPVAKVYYSNTCGCCANYVSYLKYSGFKVEPTTVADIGEIKEKLSIPPELMSCHTTVVGGYTVEGHMPVEVINKLLAEKPAIKGIALPGMPNGSPGMGGWKNESWPIYELDGQENNKVFMEF